jgi:DNA-binding response OmpR family regulator
MLVAQTRFNESMNAQTTAPRPGKILVVDDSQIILRILSDALKSKGYQVFTATDGAGAVSLVRKEKPDLILLDLFFPLDVAYCGGGLRDGFLIIEWLRRMDGGKDIPVIVISGADPEKYKARSLAAGAVAFFHKPVNHDELFAAIRATLGENAAGQMPGPVQNSEV